MTQFGTDFCTELRHKNLLHLFKLAMVSPVMTFSLILTNHSPPESEVSCSDFNGSFDCDVDSNDRHSQRPTHSSQTVLVLFNFQSFTSTVDKESLLIIDVFGQSQQNNSFILSRYRTLRV